MHQNHLSQKNSLKMILPRYQLTPKIIKIKLNLREMLSLSHSRLPVQARIKQILKIKNFLFISMNTKKASLKIIKNLSKIMARIFEAKQKSWWHF
jgi:hypothetical protein